MSRARNPDSDTTELQVSDFPRELLDMLYAVSRARGENSKRQLLIEIVTAWAKGRATEHILVQRVFRGNPALQELAGMDSE